MGLDPKDLLKLNQQDFQRPWPRWAKLAAARFLHILLPRYPAARWMKCFESADFDQTLSPILSDGWIWGRLAHYNVTLKEMDPENYALFSKITWIRKFALNEGHPDIETGDGLIGMVLHQLEEVLRQPAGQQIGFWRSFSQGFDSRMFPRKRDGKAGRIYLFLILSWPLAEKCATVRQLYDFVFRSIPAETCPESVDPIDFEDRQIKWFEKLCQRNLGLSLGKRGRPRTTKNPPMP